MFDNFSVFNDIGTFFIAFLIRSIWTGIHGISRLFRIGKKWFFTVSLDCCFI